MRTSERVWRTIQPPCALFVGLIVLPGLAGALVFGVTALLGHGASARTAVGVAANLLLWLLHLTPL